MKHFLTVVVQGYRHKNRNICSFSSHNTHVDELRGILQERTGMNRIREEGENLSIRKLRRRCTKKRRK
jgi:hypothetical protein